MRSWIVGIVIVVLQVGTIAAGQIADTDASRSASSGFRLPVQRRTGCSGRRVVLPIGPDGIFRRRRHGAQQQLQGRSNLRRRHARSLQRRLRADRRQAHAPVRAAPNGSGGRHAGPVARARAGRGRGGNGNKRKRRRRSPRHHHHRPIARLRASGRGHRAMPCRRCRRAPTGGSGSSSTTRSGYWPIGSLTRLRASLRTARITGFPCTGTRLVPGKSTCRREPATSSPGTPSKRPDERSRGKPEEADGKPRPLPENHGV